MILIGFLILSCFVPARAQSATDLPLPVHLPNQYGVIGVRAQHNATGLYIVKLHPDGPARAAGLRVGDHITAIPPYRIDRTDELSRYVQSFAPGQSISIAGERAGEPFLIECPVTDVYHLYPLMAEEGQFSEATSQRHLVWSKTVGATENTLRELAAHHQVEFDVEALNEALSLETSRYGADARLQDIHFALNHPLKAEQQASYIGKAIQSAMTLTDYLQIAQRHLDLSVLPAPASSNSHSPIHIETLLSDLELACIYADSAFAALSIAEHKTLMQGIPALLERFEHSFSLDEGSLEESDRHKATLRLAKRVKLSSLFDAAYTLTRYTDAITPLQWMYPPTLTDSLPQGIRGEILYAHHTPLGWVLIGGKGPNYYALNAWCIIDLGGNDIYVRPQDETNAQQPSARLFIDYAGDDRYIGGAGSAIGAVELLIDKEGDDHYQGDSIFQGAAFCGIGIVWDQMGDDIYSGQSAGQGTAFFGTAILVDQEGEDLFNAAHIAQGFGGMRGFGLLADKGGSDLYIADHRTPSIYGEEGQFAGWAQGVGCGFRGFGSGGIGVLYDGSGNDRYQAGEFSQGVGYFFAMGLLFDDSGSDEYRGRRYAQGAAAHQAIGLLVDGEGNDHYRTKGAASLGSAWDAAIGYLEDRAGDDIYHGETLSQGAAAMNGWGILVDRSGHDRYRAKSGQAQGSSTAYWGGRNALNFGVLIDAGEHLDTYSQRNRQNYTTQKTPGIGLFLDH